MDRNVRAQDIADKDMMTTLDTDEAEALLLQKPYHFFASGARELRHGSAQGR